jgi:predicted tellurium resistance membrane protein TerC
MASPTGDRTVTLSQLLTSADAWVSLVTLTALEIVLGIDNIVFITILAGKLPEPEQPRARRLGLAFALVTRILLLFGISWLMSLDETLATVAGFELSGRHLILLVGGLFLIGKATYEIFERLEVEHDAAEPPAGRSRLVWVIVQIMLLDVVFSIDSVITAVGMSGHLAIMVTAVVLAVAIMMVFAGPVGDFVNRHPSMKVLALAFLLLVGVLLVAEAFGQHIDKGYVYFAMAFSLAVELLNMRARKARARPVHLHNAYETDLERSDEPR